MVDEPRPALVGFKMTRGQNEDGPGNVLRDPGVRKIVLKRRNRIKTFVSTLVAERSGQWEVYSQADLVEPEAEGRAERRPNCSRHIAENDAYYARIEDAMRSVPSSRSGRRLRRSGQVRSNTRGCLPLSV